MGLGTAILIVLFGVYAGVLAMYAIVLVGVHVLEWLEDRYIGE